MFHDKDSIVARLQRLEEKVFPKKEDPKPLPKLGDTFGMPNRNRIQVSGDVSEID
jgi:hypothetical protein